MTTRIAKRPDLSQVLGHLLKCAFTDRSRVRMKLSELPERLRRRKKRRSGGNQEVMTDLWVV